MAGKVTLHEKINLLFFISSYGIGGFERVLKDLVDKFDKTRFSITVVLCYPLYKSKHISPEMRQKYFRFLSWNEVERFEIDLKSQFQVQVIFRLVEILKKQKTQVLFFFSLGMGTFIAPLAGKIAGVPLIIRTSANLLEGLYPRIFRPVDSLFMKFIQKIIFPAAYLKDEYLKYFKIDNHKISVIYNGVNVSSYALNYQTSQIKQKLGVTNKDKIIGIIANLIPVKAHEVLIKALPSVIEKFPDTKLLIIGEGPRKSELSTLVSELDLENKVIFLGYRSDIAELISIFDVGVLCSISEINPVALLEMMASGIPVVASRVGGIPEIVKHDKNGLLFSEGKWDELGQCILKLLENKKEADILGKTAQKQVRDHFSLEGMIDNYQNLIINMSQ